MVTYQAFFERYNLEFAFVTAHRSTMSRVIDSDIVAEFCMNGDAVMKGYSTFCVQCWIAGIGAEKDEVGIRVVGEE